MDIFDCSTNYCGGREAAPCNPCCKERKALPECVSPAMAYVPFQQWEDIYNIEKVNYEEK